MSGKFLQNSCKIPENFRQNSSEIPKINGLETMDLLRFWGEKGEKKGWEFLNCLPRTSAGSWRSQNPKISGNDPKIPEKFMRNSWIKEPRNHGVVESFYWKKFGVKTAKNGKKPGGNFGNFIPRNSGRKFRGGDPKNPPKMAPKMFNFQPERAQILGRKPQKTGKKPGGNFGNSIPRNSGGRFRGGNPKIFWG